MKNVIDTIEITGPLDRRNVGRFFDNADELLVARRVGAVHTRVDVGDVVANGAEAQLGLHFADGVGEQGSVVFAGAKDVESQPLGALVADARQLLQFVNQPSHWFGELGQSVLLESRQAHAAEHSAQA